MILREKILVSFKRPCPCPALVTLLTYPVSSCAAEHSFSGMKTLKTPLRSTMSDERLSSLAILHIHKHKDVDIDSEITDFSHPKASCERQHLIV